MEKYYTIAETSALTGITRSRLRYIEARFPHSVNRLSFSEDGQFYAKNQLDTFKTIDSLISSNSPSLYSLMKDNSAIKSARFITIASGKGGVGKTSICVNLALLAAKTGFKTILIDGDCGMADAHALLGIRPKKDISALIEEESTVDDVIINTFYNLKFIAGGNGTFDLANLSQKNLIILENKFKALKQRFQFVLIDSPAGIGKTVLKWVGAGNELIVVTTPSPTALLDAYGLIKVSIEKGFISSAKVIVNMTTSKAQGEQTFQTLNQCSKKFLGFPLEYLGSVRRDPKVEQALLAKTPLALNENYNGAISNLNEISKNIFKI